MTTVHGDDGVCQFRNGAGILGVGIRGASIAHPKTDAFITGAHAVGSRAHPHMTPLGAHTLRAHETECACTHRWQVGRIQGCWRSLALYHACARGIGIPCM